MLSLYKDFWELLVLTSNEMKSFIKILAIVFLSLKLMSIISCKEDESVEPVLTAPVLTTVSISGITQTSAVSGGSISDDGGAAVTARGVCYGTSASPTTSGSKTSDGSGSGAFASTITGLTINTKYFVRAYATNSKGTSYGNEVSFTTNPVALATLTTITIGSVTRTSAVSGGAITDDGGGDISARGVCWSKVQNPTVADSKTTDGTGKGNFVSNITGLLAATTYYVRAYATNSAGTAYGNEVSFITDPIAFATVTTTAVSSRTTSSAVSGGTITDSGGGTISARGVCWSTEENPLITDSKTTDGSGMGTFTSTLTGLTPNTIYYVNAYAINEAGVTYGTQASFITLPNGTIVFNPNLTYGSVSDVDGNTYKTIQIGTQTWMAENLKTTKFNDNTPISLVTDNTAWSNLYVGKTPAYSWYDNDPSTYKPIYGALYNHYVVEKGNVCPTGWHVPSDAEGATLETFLGGEDVAGGKLKEAGNTHWTNSFSAVATNESGFTALPGGARDVNGPFGASRSHGMWWSTTIESQGFYWSFSLFFDNSKTYGGAYYESAGLSVRCLKD